MLEALPDALTQVYKFLYSLLVLDNSVENSKLGDLTNRPVEIKGPSTRWIKKSESV
jgi:hypothetical protein